MCLTPRPLRLLTPQRMLGYSETERCAQNFPAAGQPSPAKTLLHRGPTQGTCSQGLMAKRLIARISCTQPVLSIGVPHGQASISFILRHTVGVSADLKPMIIARRPKTKAESPYGGISGRKLCILVHSHIDSNRSKVC